MKEIRLLRADEIEIRVARCCEDYIQLLLYKDARCDMNILDETFGITGWQRHHSRDNANCIVSIWDEDKKQWIDKEDTGVESNTQKEKGLASDSFKRACTNVGIGRELYSAKNIYVKPHTYTTKKDDEVINRSEVEWDGDKKTYKITKDFRYYVKSIEYNDKREISHLIICDKDDVERFKI